VLIEVTRRKARSVFSSVEYCTPELPCLSSFLCKIKGNKRQLYRFYARLIILRRSKQEVMLAAYRHTETPPLFT
jgi:hypothetical protein